MKQRKSPWWYIPTLYFQQGLPVILIQQFSVILYKKLGVSNEQIGLWTSLITWPWILKMFWGPWVDGISSKLSWVKWTQILITILIFISGAFVTSDHFLLSTLVLFCVAAFLSATHDIALDAYYLLALKPDEQAFFVGIRSTFFRLAMIFCSGGLVVFAGYLEEHGTSIARSFQFAIWASAAIYGLFMLNTRINAPQIDHDVPSVQNSQFKEAFKTFFTQPGIGVIIAFLLIYRVGESMAMKMAGVFMLDSKSVGGLGLSTIEVGVLTGNVGIIALVVGGVLGGICISRFGFRKCLWPMALVMYLPNLLYLWAAYSQPGPSVTVWVIGTEQFGYGFGMASYMVYAMAICKDARFKASHYAIVTGIMAFGSMLSGMSTGYIQKAFGYPGFFLIVCLACIPGAILLKFIPQPESA